MKAIILNFQIDSFNIYKFTRKVTIKETRNVITTVKRDMWVKKMPGNKHVHRRQKMNRILKIYKSSVVITKGTLEVTTGNKLSLIHI